MSLRSSTRSWRRLAGLGAAVGILLLSAGRVDSTTPRDRADAGAFWRVGIPRPIAVRGGRATFRLPAPGPTSQTLVIVSVLSRRPGPFPIRLVARPTKTATIPELAEDGPRREPEADATPRVTDSPRPADDARPARRPVSDRVFHLMVREGDPGIASNYVAVRGVLRGVGRGVQVYVASEDVARVARETIRDIIVTFDDRIYPAACERLGAARDVDGDGRLTVLLSSWLDHLGGGRHAVDGFVKVADLDATMPAPLGNRCDMVYLNASMSAGPYLRTVLAHEYRHAVVYSRKTLDQADGSGAGPEEEGWLDEAIAHLAEDEHGFSPSNIDYRVSAFLSCPERYELVVDDYFAANLFRSHGNRGSTYLFLRWCADRYGPGLIPKLVESPRRGVSNIEAATGSTFADLFRRWTLATVRSGLDPWDESGDGFRSTHLYAPWAEGELAGPRYRRVSPGGPDDRWDAAGTSSHYVLVDGDAAAAVEVEVSGPPEAELQVTAMPMGEDRARLSMSIHAEPGPDGQWMAMARVSEHNGVPVRLSALSWEPLVPAPRPHAEGPGPGRIDRSGIAACFGASALPGRGSLDSRPIPLPGVSPESGPIVVKVLATDPLGRHVAAWADLRIPRSDPPHDR